MEKDIHPKIRKTIYELSHDRHLQKSHTIAQLGAGVLFVFLGGVAAYVIDGRRIITPNLILFTLFVSALIFVIFYSIYLLSKDARLMLIKKIESLNSEAKKL